MEQLPPSFIPGDFGTPIPPPKFTRKANALRRVTRVSRHAISTTKQVVWDSNEPAIEIMTKAVDQYETWYTALRGLVVGSAQNAKNVYVMAKTNAGKLENKLLLPVRDWILLPAFSNAEQAVAISNAFLKSQQARDLAQNFLHHVSNVPLVGGTILKPSILVSAKVLRQSWHVLQYPIPSQESVRNTVDWTLNTTKHILTLCGREIALYVQRADANITRTLSHTQWKVLNSGPYVTLDQSTRQLVVSHVTERYLNQPTQLSRYELYTHIQKSNTILCQDLQQSLLAMGVEDAWLQDDPVYYDLSVAPRALFFCQVQTNGKTNPHAPWSLLRYTDQRSLQDAYEREQWGASPVRPPEPILDEARWYTPVPTDVLVEQQRYAVSLYQDDDDSICMIRRPVFWRFLGRGDPVRRATWFLDTGRHGIQPFGAAAARILEDAYLCLIHLTEQDPDNKQHLLTVEVPGPDGTERLVQFSSLTRATAIQKGLGAAMALFKRRVYRGVARDAEESSLAVPLERLDSPDIARQLEDYNNTHKIDHLCLVVHGIGEMMRSLDWFGLTLPTLPAVCGCMRTNHTTVQQAHFAEMYPNAAQSTGRVEYLPVEWHEAFAKMTRRRSSTTAASSSNILMKDISLPTIPNMRDFANDTLMDVLFFMAPEHHDTILEVVSTELNLVVQKFRDITGFSGPVSIIGHSLGSVISWDILNHQRIRRPLVLARLDAPADGTELDPPAEYQLNFETRNFVMLGSPLPVFLMIRNQREPLSDDFSLTGCPRVFNIFHPYDPVAYRLEPCIEPRNAEFEPSLIKHWNGGFRVQYRTRRIWRKLVERTTKTQHDVVEAFEQSMAGMGLLDAAVDSADDDTTASSVSEDRGTNGLVTGQLNQGRRIDYLLQEKEIENANEYVSALAAHSSYWIEKDLSLFIARQIYLSSLESSVREFEAATPELATWESITPEDTRM